LTESIKFVDELIEEDFDLVKELKIGNGKLGIGIRK